MSSLFSRGIQSFQDIEAENLRQAANKELRKLGPPFFFQDGEVKTLQFYYDAPIIYWAHCWYKPTRAIYICTDHEAGCPICRSPELDSRPQQCGYMPVRWLDAPEYSNKPQNDILFNWDMRYSALAGMFLAQKMLKEGALNDSVYVVGRNGNTYAFNRQSKYAMTEKDYELMKGIPKWEEVIKPPTKDELELLLSGRRGIGKFGNNTGASGNVPPPAYNRAAYAPPAEQSQPVQQYPVAGPAPVQYATQQYAPPQAQAPQAPPAAAAPPLAGYAPPLQKAAPPAGITAVPVEVDSDGPPPWLESGEQLPAAAPSADPQVAAAAQLPTDAYI